ncbi:MAG: hypothetical protein P8X91_07330, partial [Candidatus Bathyarchaeota archaeon]
EKVLDAYTEKYKDPDSLLMTMTDAIQKEKELNKKLDALSPMPDGVENVDAFIEAYKQKQEELNRLNQDLKKLEIERAKIHPPDQSSEELQEQLDELNEKFDIVLRKGKAILRVREVADELSEHLDQQAFLGLKNDIESFISNMTNHRYKEIKIDESLPTGFVRGDGNIVETGLLSTGTLDVLGLALRLSMANYFLKEQEAFLVMDDPFVDMDPGRQSKAANLLKEYSKTKPTSCLSIVVDDKPDLCQKYEIKYYPTVILFRKGKIQKRLDSEPGIGLNKKQFEDFTKK